MGIININIIGTAEDYKIKLLLDALGGEDVSGKPNSRFKFSK